MFNKTPQKFKNIQKFRKKKNISCFENILLIPKKIAFS